LLKLLLLQVWLHANQLVGKITVTTKETTHLGESDSFHCQLYSQVVGSCEKSYLPKISSIHPVFLPSSSPLGLSVG